ncbi:MAG: class I poly(R)-hydroxyalkanoic acid synthase, partial [Gammaproteobacteria bacterium]
MKATSRESSAGAAGPESDSAELARRLAEIAGHGQRLQQAYLTLQTDGGSFSIPDKGVVARAFVALGARLLADPLQLLASQAAFQRDWDKLWQNTVKRLQGEAVEPVAQPEPGDKRFQDDIWSSNVCFDFIKQAYLLASRSMLEAARGAEGLDPHAARMADFYLRQWLDALAPTNFAQTNPKVVQAALDSKGETLVKGVENWLADLERGKGELRIRMTDTAAFKLGENVAVTPGKVVFQTPLMQLIQYAPATAQVYQRPLLIVPPWINKFYILDLRPKNSFIKWAVEQGFTVFVISWVNPDERLADHDFEDYLLEGTLAALDAIRQATGEPECNVIGYCIGGTLTMSTLAYLAATGTARRIKSATFFTTLVDFSEVGELAVFIDEEQIALIERQMDKRGYLEGSQMAGVFNMLRPNDLIWSFYVNNYLLGREPPAFDLLYWNSDSTRMPRAMHSFYLRNMYLHNKLREPGGIGLAGEAIDLGKIKTPQYFLATREDHIAPWQGVYRGIHSTRGKVRFVLGASGHIAGVVNPPAANKYGYWTNADLPERTDDWLAGARYREGSWWTDWLEWMKAYGGKQGAARVPGAGKL